MAGSLAPRDHFPILDRVTYLNAASIALSPLPVQREIAEFQEQVAANGTIGLDDEAEARLFDRPRASAARLFGARDQDMAIMTSATECIAQVAWWLAPGEGSNVVSLDVEFPSVTYPWLRMHRSTGVEVRLVDASLDPAAFSIDDVASAVDADTAAICVSHVQYATGHRLDPGELAALAHSHDALLILDATQSAGAVPIDAPGTDQDVVIASAYKWLCGPLGGAATYLRPEVWERFDPLFVGPRSTANTYSFDATRIELARAARRMEYSTISYSAAIGVAACIDYLMDIGIERILDHDLALGSRLLDGCDRLGGEPVTPRHPSGRAGVVSVRFPGRQAERLAARLGAVDVIVAPRLGAIRFSPHLYNDETDVDRALSELEQILATPDKD
jgi:cysteine desulfurase/selenocysteine lyase